MCLSKLSNRPKNLKTYKLGVGWKVFNTTLDGKKPRFVNYNHKGRCTVQLKTWLVSNKPICVLGPNIAYPPRFHIYLRKPRNEPIRTFKVKFKDPVAVGYQWGRPVVVASKMYVMENK